MGDAYMELGERELEKIGKYVQSHLDEWNRNTILNFQNSRDIELLERTVRVEEGLKSSMELTRQGFDMMDKRFEQVDKRFEEMQHNMDKRFEQVDKRLDLHKWAMGIGVTVILAVMSFYKFFII